MEFAAAPGLELQGGGLSRLDDPMARSSEQVQNRIYQNYEGGAEVDASHRRWDSLPAGKYSVNIIYQRSDKTSGNYYQQIELAQGENEIVKFSPPAGTSSLYGVVTLDGQPLKHVHVSMSNNSLGKANNNPFAPQGNLSASTDEQGMYRFLNINDGEFSISAQAGRSDGSNGERISQKVTVKGATRCDLAMQSGHKLTGTLALTNDPASGKWRFSQITVNRVGGTDQNTDWHGRSVITNGQFAMAGKFKGDYTISLSCMSGNGVFMPFELPKVTLDTTAADQDLGTIVCPPLGMLNINLTTPQIVQERLNISIMRQTQNGGRRQSGMEATLSSGANLLGPMETGAVQLSVASSKYQCTVAPNQVTISDSVVPTVTLTLSPKATPTP